MAAHRTIHVPLILLAALVAGLTLTTATAAGRAHFGRSAVAGLPGHHLLDVGVADYDDDGFLDLFTTNHKFHSVLLHNDGAGGFADRLAPAGLGPTPEFPGLELLKAPAMDEPGLYVYLGSRSGKGVRSYVRIRAVGMGGRGRLTFGSENVRVERHVDADVTIGKSDAGQPSVGFDARPGAVIDISLRHVDLPIAASFEDPAPRDVRIGTDAIRAGSKAFILTLRDRHGIAFADLGGDRETDAFAVSGGLGGGIKLPGYRGQIQDELLIGRGARFTNESAGSGLEKGSCRGREAASVDVDGDGLLDLFEGCEGRAPRIYRQVSPGHFAPSAAPAAVATTYRWADLRGDSRPELLAAESSGIGVYRVGAGGTKLVQRIEGNARSGRVAQFALADFDSDGDLDVLAPSGSGTTMLENRHGRLRRLPLGRLGLPQRSVAASFVDYDNDGLLDLHLVPQGLFHRMRPSSFRRTGLETTRRTGAAITTWFDYDNDGLRDPVVATGPSSFSNAKTVSRAHNLGPGGHWLEVDLNGADGNAQAIGGRVQIRCGRHREFGFVGQSDDSRYSQGHYRLYFGLGACAVVREAVVRWPDGRRSRFGPLRADRLIRLSYPG